MPKKSIVLNGFPGGLDFDKDASDIVTKGQNNTMAGKDEAVEAENCSLELSGKVEGSFAETYLFATNTIEDANNISTATDLIHFGGKLYQNIGLYKMGDVVNWSENAEYSAFPAYQGMIGDFPTQEHAPAFDTLTGGCDVIVKPEYNKNTYNPDLNIYIGARAPGNPKLDHHALVYNEESAQTYNATLSEERFAWGTDDNNNAYAQNHGHMVDMKRLKAITDYTSTGPDVTYGLLVGCVGQSSITSSNSWSSFDLAGTGGVDSNLKNNCMISMYRTANSSHYPYLTFKTAESEYNAGVNVNGGFGVKCNVTGKSILLDVRFSEYGLRNLEYLHVTLDCDPNNSMFGFYNYTDNNVRTYIVKPEQIVSAGAAYREDITPSPVGTLPTTYRNLWDNGFGTIIIPESVYIQSGSAFDPTDVCSVHVGLKYRNATIAGLGVTHTQYHELCSFRQISLIDPPSVSATWVNNKFIWYQTTINNGIESLARPFNWRNQHNPGDDAGGLMANHKFRQNCFDYPAQVPNQKVYIIRPDNNSGITAGKVYVRKADNNGEGYGDKFLVAEWDYTKGVKGVGGDEWLAWETKQWAKYSTGGNQTYKIRGIVFSDMPILETYENATGYPISATSVNALWKTAAVVGRQIYIGNVAVQKDVYNVNTRFPSQYGSTRLNYHNQPGGAGTKDTIVRKNETHGYDDIFSGASGSPPNIDVEVGDWFYITGSSVTANNNRLFQVHSLTTATENNDTITITESNVITTGLDNNNLVHFHLFKDYDPSLVLKSVIGAPGGFPDTQYIDLEFGGQEIKVLESAGDRLLVFSEDKLVIINVAQDIEFLEATFNEHGIKDRAQICKVGEGVAWVNGTGVYWFNGQEVKDLTMDKAQSIEWASNDCAIQYVASMKGILVINDKYTGSPTSYFYSLKDQSWSSTKTHKGAIPNQMAQLTNSYTVEGGKSIFKVLGLTNSYYSKRKSAGVIDKINFKTGRISCGDLSRRKKFYKVYVNANAATNVYMKYRLDGTGSWSSAADLAALIGGASGRAEISLSGANGKDIQLWFYDKNQDTSGGDADRVSVPMELQDITIIYREKSVK